MTSDNERDDLLDKLEALVRREKLGGYSQCNGYSIHPYEEASRVCKRCVRGNSVGCFDLRNILPSLPWCCYDGFHLIPFTSQMV